MKLITIRGGRGIGKKITRKLKKIRESKKKVLSSNGISKKPKTAKNKYKVSIIQDVQRIFLPENNYLIKSHKN